MSKFNIKELINTFSQLGQQLSAPDEELAELINNEHRYNAWFTPASVERAVKAIGQMLNEAELTTWLSNYELTKNTSSKKIGLILAGNIPLVGFHDVLCVLITGNHALIKASVQDARLIKHVLEKLVAIDGRFSDQFSFVERLADFDAVIATGSNNSSRYFEYYFGKVPNIIRKNRNSLAVITGDETQEQLYNLGHDIFDYYGLGCRNVSKILIPKDYNLATFFEAIELYYPIINHHKYNNNYDYNKSIYLVNSDKHLDNGFLLVKEDERFVSPLAVLYYSYYDDLQAAEELIKTENENIQCVVSSVPLKIKSQVVNFGMSQQPQLWDYADGIDTMDFLANLHTFEAER
ncbi:acyl-CoA reductase [Mucilaginibacter sp.]|uniref:acyl-CoA reductase n=1 Tax=Mucilaginibacter sp. TaxID=1882438 RepID=UPI00261780F3|nr:acyl-CoA reductase [Mucilaginibacter sp.]MDB4924559.1 acyl-CoA reductase [Mucilaginibacter sp.]